MKTKEKKNSLIQELTKKLNEYDHFYLTDISELDAEKTSDLRRKCFEKNIKLEVVKNTLFKKAIDQSDKTIENIDELLKDSTSVMFCETANAPGKLIKDLRKDNEKPILKAAFVEQSFYVGDDQIEALADLKSKEELIADLIYTLKDPMNRVLSSLKSSSHTIAGIVKTLSEK